MRNRFDKELEILNTELIEMGLMIETAINNSITALINRNHDLAKLTAQGDGEINEKEKLIEGRCLKLLLQQQPVAADLRIISVALKMITDMERIGDQARDISFLTLDLLKQQYTNQLVYIPSMAEKTRAMVRNSIDSFIHRDIELAKQVILSDDEVDALFLQVKKDLIEKIRGGSEDGEFALDLLMIAKYFERIGDHATNIAEWVIFSMTGQHKSLT